MDVGDHVSIVALHAKWHQMSEVTVGAVTSVAVTGLREEKRDATRRAITTAALDLFEQYGYEATTMDEIAAHAGVSRRTLFRYVDGKDDLLFAHDSGWVAAFERGVEQHEGQPLEVVLRGASRVVCAHISDDPEPVLRAMALFAETPSVWGRTALLDRAWSTLVADLAERHGLSRLRATRSRSSPGR